MRTYAWTRRSYPRVCPVVACPSAMRVKLYQKELGGLPGSSERLRIGRSIQGSPLSDYRSVSHLCMKASVTLTWDVRLELNKFLWLKYANWKTFCKKVSFPTVMFVYETYEDELCRNSFWDARHRFLILATTNEYETNLMEITHAIVFKYCSGNMNAYVYIC